VIARKDDMHIRWFGQAAFLLTAEHSVLIDPFAIPESDVLRSRGMVFDYPPIKGVAADLVLITHEHFDHNGVEVAKGSPQVIRSTAGRFGSCIGEILAVAAEHDDVAGTKRGPNTIFCFTLAGLRFCHLGDYGQARLRATQERAIGEIDVLFLPVGGGPTVSVEAAVALARTLQPRLVVPMHYRTEALSFLESPDAFLDALDLEVERLDRSETVVEPLLGTHERPRVVLLAPPLR
jgi:L-ascorbate metabolism protein UlaG (beta-lactamase superfamily)